MPIDFKLHTDSASPLSEQLKHQIELAVARGDLVKGEAMPSTRQLAKELKINPNTIGKAFQALVQTGTLSSQPGKGYFVAAQSQRYSKAEIERQINAAAEQFIVSTRPLGISKARLLSALDSLIPEDSEDD
jgi:GntR family transcriptional regulator